MISLISFVSVRSPAVAGTVKSCVPAGVPAVVPMVSHTELGAAMVSGLKFAEVPVGSPVTLRAKVFVQSSRAEREMVWYATTLRLGALASLQGPPRARSLEGVVLRP